MKASQRFIEVLAEGIAKLNDHYGEQKIKQAHDMLVYQMVHNSITPGHEHNAKFEAEPIPWFDEEAKKLKDAHLRTAIKMARKKARNGSEGSRRAG
jgi:hypothetical protein